MDSAFGFVDGSVFFVYGIPFTVDKGMFHFSMENLRFSKRLLHFSKINPV